MTVLEDHTKDSVVDSQATAGTALGCYCRWVGPVLSSLIIFRGQGGQFCAAAYWVTAGKSHLEISSWCERTWKDVLVSTSQVGAAACPLTGECSWEPEQGLESIASVCRHRWLLSRVATLLLLQLLGFCSCWQSDKSSKAQYQNAFILLLSAQSELEDYFLLYTCKRLHQPKKDKPKFFSSHQWCFTKIS